MKLCAMPEQQLVLYRFRYRDERTGKVRETLYHLSEAGAKERYGASLVERLEQTREVRQVQEHRGHYPRG